MKLSGDAIAEIGAESSLPGVGAFFDLDGTLVERFTAAVHVGDRIRRRQAGFGELLGVFEAALRYKFGLVPGVRAPDHPASGYLRGEALAELDGAGPAAIRGTCCTPTIHTCMTSSRRIRNAAIRVMSSSALSIQALPVARFLGIANVQRNHFELDEHGRLTGGIVKPCRLGRDQGRRGPTVLHRQRRGPRCTRTSTPTAMYEHAVSMTVGCPRPANRADRGSPRPPPCTDGR